MILKIYKSAFYIALLIFLGQPAIAQGVISDTSEKQSFDQNKSGGSDFHRKLDMAINTLDQTFKNLDQKLQLEKLGTEISDEVNGMVTTISSGAGDQNESELPGDAQERIKTYSKSYPADANDKLQIENKYGRVNVNTWAKNEVRVDVQIKGDASDDETAQKFIDAINISDSKDGNTISFRTVFGNNSGSIWNLFGNMSNHRKIEVNYTVYMPATMSLDMNNRYGAVLLPSLSGKVTLNNAYGSLTAKSLTNPSNELNFKYYEVSIDELAGGEINLAYGSLKLGSVGSLDANVNYAPIDIGKLASSGSLNVRYGGGIKISEISKALKNLDINSSYSSVNIGLKGDESFDFDVTVKYGSFNYDENKLKITSKSPSDDAKGFHPTKSYRGYMGSNNSSNKITISSTYQSVKLE
jgi:hypothetical protein